MKIKVVYFYLLFVLWVMILALLLKFAHLNVTGLGVMFTFLTFVLAPGFFLWRISGLRTENFPSAWLYILGLGLGYHLFINLWGILLNLPLSACLGIAFLVGILIFILAFWRDRKATVEFNFSVFKRYEIADWLLLFFILVFSLVAFLTIDAQSEKLIGDGWFHLAILEKVVSSHGLSPYNLWVVKTAALNPVYSFPVWHILVGEITEILSISIFTALKQVLLPLVVLCLVTWYSFASIVFRSRYLVWVSFLAFLLVFLKDNNFYYLVALASPDSLNRLLLMPLVLGLSVSWIFSGGHKIFNLSLIAILVILMGLIHFTQLIYFVLILVMVLIFALVLRQKREVMGRVLAILGGVGVLVLPYLLIFQREAVSSFLKGISSPKTDNPDFNTYLGANIIYRYAILSLPIIALFVKKNARFLILLAVVITSLLIYWPFLGARSFFLKYFGEIFVSRSLANIPHFLFVGFLLFLLIVGLDYLLVWVFKKFIWLANILIIFLFLLIILVIPGQTANLVEKFILNETNPLLTGYFWLFFTLIVVLVGVIYFVFRQKIEIPPPKNKINFAILTIFSIVFLALPYFGGVKKVLVNNPNGTILSARMTDNASDIEYFGGNKTIEFWRSLAKKVFLTDNVTLAQMILLYSDNFVAEYPYGIKDFSLSPNFYNNNLSLEERLSYLDQWQVDFVVVRHQKELSFYENNPAQFKLVFENHYSWQKPRDLYIFEYLKN